MRIYFLSEIPCALFINGALFGTVDLFERSVEISPLDGVFCELKPCGYLPVRFRLNEAFLFAPPPQTQLYFTENGAAVYCRDFKRADPQMHLLWQTRQSGALLTLYVQGTLQLVISDGRDMHTVALPWALEHSRCRAAGDFFVLESDTHFALLDRTGTICAFAEGKVLECGDPLRAEIFFRDSMQHSAVCEYRGGKPTACKIYTAREATEATFAAAFFESVLIGADATPFLTPALADKAPMLREFLGDFRSVVVRERPNTAGLVYEIRPRVFEVRDFCVVLDENRKIENVRACT